MSKVDMKLAEKHLKAMRNRHYDNTAGQYIGYSLSFGPGFVNNQACAAGLASFQTDSVIGEDGVRIAWGRLGLKCGGINAVLAIPLTRQASKGYTRPYLNWLINESGVADVFLTKDVEKALRSGLVLDPDKNYLKLQMAVISLRALSEHSDMLPTWYKLYKAGVDGNLALIVAHHSSGKAVLVRSSRGHSMLKYKIDEYTLGYVKSLIEGNYEEVPSFRKTLNYGSCSKAPLSYGPSLRGEIGNNWEVYSKSTTKNPFRRFVDSEGIDYDKSIAKLIPILLQVQKKALALGEEK